MPSIFEKKTEEKQEASTEEDDEALTQLLKERMKNVPWVKDAVRARKRQQGAQEKKGAGKNKGQEKKVTGYEKKQEA